MNPHKGEVAFEALGQTYVFKFGTYAMAILQRKTGIPIGKFFETRTDFGADECLLIFYSCLFQKHKLTEEQVGDILDEIGFEKAGEIIHEAIGLSTAPQEDANGKSHPRKGTPAKASISTRP